MTDPLPIILLPGMAADHTQFRFLHGSLPELITPDWISPLENESLPDYAARIAQSLDPGRPCFVGGASFGGIVALEMATRIQAEACFLIASIRSRDELPWRYRLFQPIGGIGPKRFGMAAEMVERGLSPVLPRLTATRLKRLSGPRAEFMRWACLAVLNWRPSLEIAKIRVHQIHGERDRMFPVKSTRPDVVVAGAGHGLTRSHPEAVQEFIRRGIDRSRIDRHFS